MGVQEYLGLIFKTVAAIFCAAAVGINTTIGMTEVVTSNSFMYATGGFIILLVIFIGWTIIKEGVDTTFAGWMMVCGFIWNLGAGLGVILYYIRNSDLMDIFPLVSGCLGVGAGVVMLVDALHSLGVF